MRDIIHCMISRLNYIKVAWRAFIISIKSIILTNILKKTSPQQWKLFTKIFLLTFKRIYLFTFSPREWQRLNVLFIRRLPAHKADRERTRRDVFCLLLEQLQHGWRWSWLAEPVMENTQNLTRLLNFKD